MSNQPLAASPPQPYALAPMHDAAATLVTTANGVKIVGHANMPSRIAADASALYARNLFNFVSLLVDKKTGQLAIDWNDEIVKGALVAKDGAVVERS